MTSNLQGLFRRVGFFGLRPGQKFRYPDDRIPLYARRSPWWCQWAYALLGCNLLMTATAVELTWSYWTEPVKQEDEEQERYELRPLPVRLGVVCVHLFVGSVGAAALLAARSRYTRTLDILDRQSPARIFLQTGNDGGRNGYTLPLDRCWLRPGRSEDELFLGVDGERGLWQIGLKNCLINGTRLSVQEGSEQLESAFSGRIMGQIRKLHMEKSPWKSGVMKGACDLFQHFFRLASMLVPYKRLLASWSLSSPVRTIQGSGEVVVGVKSILT